MFKFEYIEHLWALWALPIAIVFFLLAWRWRKKAILAFASPGLIQKLAPDISKNKHYIKLVLLLIGLALLIIGWANPQWGTKREEVQKKSSDVFIALDISNSMLAQDISPSRLDRARQFTQNLVMDLRGERIGIILFAGSAYLQMPLTTDYAAASLFIKSANPEQASTQGTALAEAIRLARESFDQEEEYHKAMIIISDGEDHEEDALEQAREANKNGVTIFTVGAGTAEGAFIPTKVGTRQGFKRDKKGGVVRSKLNKQMLDDIANAGGGEYFNLLEGDKIRATLKDKIEQIEKRELEQSMFDRYESYFQYFLFAALFFLTIEFLLPYQKSKWLEGKDLFKI